MFWGFFLFLAFWSDSHKYQCLSKLAQLAFLWYICIWKTAFQNNLLWLWELFPQIGWPTEEGVCGHRMVMNHYSRGSPLFRSPLGFHYGKRWNLAPTFVTQNYQAPRPIEPDPKPRFNPKGFKSGWKQTKAGHDQLGSIVCVYVCIHSTKAWVCHEEERVRRGDNWAAMWKVTGRLSYEYGGKGIP